MEYEVSFLNQLHRVVNTLEMKLNEKSSCKGVLKQLHTNYSEAINITRIHDNPNEMTIIGGAREYADRGMDYYGDLIDELGKAEEMLRDILSKWRGEDMNCK